MKENIDRRGFFRLTGRVVAGVGAGVATVPLDDVVNRGFSNATSLRTVNAYLNNTYREQCARQPDKRACARRYERSPGFLFRAGAEGPFSEEVLFRAFPSYLVGRWERDKDPLKTQLVGTGGYSMNRREVLAGGLSSVLFAASHNITESNNNLLNLGIDTKTVPASAVSTGMILWYLQRKLGFATNFLAHSVYNITAIFTS